MTTVMADRQLLIQNIANLIENGTVSVNKDYILWQSGVYSLVDCVFSAQAKYKSIVLPMMELRLAARPKLQDQPKLTFSAFLADIDSFGADKIERYAEEVLTRQVIAKRRKVAICYEAAQYFVARGLETKDDLRAIGDEKLEKLILSELRWEIHGIGEALSRFLLMRLGIEGHIKPDVKMVRFFGRLSDWKPRTGNTEDAEMMRSVVIAVANNFDTTASRLDEAIWLYETQ